LPDTQIAHELIPTMDEFIRAQFSKRWFNSGLQEGLLKTAFTERAHQLQSFHAVVKG
jgi:hypothetical protein